jgi:hypothetical protein
MVGTTSGPHTEQVRRTRPRTKPMLDSASVIVLITMPPTDNTPHPLTIEHRHLQDDVRRGLAYAASTLGAVERRCWFHVSTFTVKILGRQAGDRQSVAA